MELETWRGMLNEQMEAERDPGPVIAYAPNEEDFDRPFDAGYGGADGPFVLAWTAQRVYFPVTYDGAEWLGSAPRDPQAKGQAHVGGG